MKVFVIVALFAFVAVQVCQSAPAPEEEKKEEVAAAPAVPAAAPAAVPAVPAVAAESSAAPVTAEVKVENAPSEAPKPAAAVVEEKKP